MKQSRNYRILGLLLGLSFLFFCSGILQAEEIADYGNIFPMQVDQLASDSIMIYQIVWMSAILAGIIAYGVYRTIRHKDPILLFTMGSGIIAFFNEGNLEVLVHVTMPVNSIMPVYQAYGIIMPFWMLIGYTAVFPLLSYIAYSYLKKGLETKGFIILWVLFCLFDFVAEVPGVAMGAYVYQPPQMLTFLGFPIYNMWINGTSWLLGGVLMYFFVPILTGWKRPLISLLPFFAFATGWGIIDVPIVIALNFAGMPAWGKWVLWFVSLGLSILIVVTLNSMVTTTSKTRWRLPWATLDAEIAAEASVTAPVLVR
ncbi:MAG: hypothetical protein ABIK92_14830 [Pseudomonadota bacterium]